MNKYPKILVVSHNSFSDTFNNGKTFSKIFKKWPSESLAQLYFQNEQPSFEVCNNFYKITDEDMIFKKKNNVGQIVFDTTKIMKTQSTLHGFARRKPLPFFSFVRNLIWVRKRWNNKNLETWIRDFEPEAIFLVGGSASFPYKIANYFSEKMGIPIYLYYTDDYITVTKKIDPFWWLNFLWLKITLTKTLKNVAKVFVIGDDMANEYRKKLGKECITLMNAIDFSEYYNSPQKVHDTKKEFSIAYFGGLHLNRWKTLLKIANSLRNIEHSDNLSLKLYIYTQSSLSAKEMMHLKNHPNIVMKLPVGADEIIEEMKKYYSLVHVESFEQKMMETTRLSISTKIPEYFASGCLVIGVGHENLSSIRYLRKSEVAYTITSDDVEVIEKEIKNIILNRDNHLNMINKGFDLALNHHSIDANHQKLTQNIINAHVVIKESDI